MRAQGLEDGESSSGAGQSKQDVSRALSISRQRVSQIHHQAVQKLKQVRAPPPAPGCCGCVVCLLSSAVHMH